MAHDRVSHRQNAMFERLKKDLEDVEYEEKRLKRELENCAVKKRKILEEMDKYSDERYEEDILKQVYEQRHNIIRDKKK